MPTTLLLYEDNNRLRDSLSDMITFSPNLLLLGAFPNVMNVEMEVADKQPDVILMDIDMPGCNGIEAVTKIRRFNHTVQIIMITIFDDNQHVLEAIIAGANGYLLKKNISDQLMNSIELVTHGEAPMSPGIARMVLQHIQKTKPVLNNPYELSPREQEILASLSVGNSYKMIAANFKISIDTVRTHIKHIYDKLQVHSQLEAVAKAVSEKLI